MWLFANYLSIFDFVFSLSLTFRSVSSVVNKIEIHVIVNNSNIYTHSNTPVGLKILNQRFLRRIQNTFQNS